MTKLETLKLDDLHVQEDYNARSAQEVNNNAKDIAAAMEATGDHREDYVVKYVEIDGKKYTRNHATLIAAKARGWDTVLARKSPFEPNGTRDMLDLLFSNNLGHPINRAQQGKIFAQLRDGLEEDQSEAIKNAKVGEEIPIKYLREPMSLDEIAAACKPARTKQHIADCIAIYESPEEIAALLEADKTSANPVLKAKQWAKGDEKKWLRICKRAIAHAEGAKATQQHFDAIKSEFVELKAVDTTAEKGSSSPTSASKSKNKGDAAPDASDDSIDDEKQQSEPEQPEAELFTEGTKKNDKLKAALVTLFLEPDNIGEVTLDDAEAEALADKVLALLVTAREIF